MQLSNRLTFSLASLIVLIAFGLVFAPISVMADDKTGNDHGTGNPQGHPDGSTTTLGHVHPTVTITVVDANLDQAGVQRYYDDMDREQLIVDVPFKLKFTFTHEPTYDAGTTLPFDANNDLLITDPRLSSLVVDSTNIPELRKKDGSASLGFSSTVASNDVKVVAETNNKEYTVEAGIFNTDTSDPQLVVDTRWITLQVAANAGVGQGVYSTLQGPLYNPSGGIGSLQKQVVIGLRADIPPLTFGTQTIDDQTYTAGTAITDLVLPEATGGSGALTYSLTNPAATGDTIPATAPGYNGLMFDPATRTLSGTPTAAKTAETYTYTVTDSATTPATQTLAFAITVDAPLDTTPPTVTPTPPASQTDGTVDFVFTFDEALGTGFNDLEVSDFTIAGAHLTGANKPTISSAGNAYTLTVTPLTATSAVTVTLKANTVQNLAGLTGPAAAVTRIYRPAASDTTPVFETTTVANLGGVCKGDNIQPLSPDGIRLIVELPLADDNEGDTLSYTLTPALPAGLSWRTTDAQKRVIEGTPTSAGTTTHTWTATDDSQHVSGDPSKDSASITFSIVVKEHQKPNKPETPAATKKNAAATTGLAIDQVVLTWNEPSAAVAKTERAYPNCIPAVTGYTVTETMWDDVSQDFVASMTYMSATGSTYADHFIAPKTGTLWTFTTPKRDHGIYKYTIMAHNSAPAGNNTSVASEFATWAVTTGTQIVVANPPAAPKDLDAAIDQDGNSVTLNWLKVPAVDEGNAPIDDSALATRTKYYGVNKGFGGYVVYRVNDATKEAKRLPETGVIDSERQKVNFYDHPTYRDSNIPAGQYVYRVTAVNVAGESLRSISTKIITIIGPGPTAPTPATAIATKDYAVFVPSNHDASALPFGMAPHTVAAMPDLGAFFLAGGTIDVAVTGKANHNVIITEIMVAKDLGRVGQSGMMRPEAGQWIELYNNTAADININDIMFTFTPGYPAAAAPANATDRLSNTVVPGWNFQAAFADALSGATATNASGVVTVTQTFKSLRRVHKDDKLLQKAGTVIQNGWAQGSWKLTADTKAFLGGRVGTPGAENRQETFKPTVFTAPTMEITISEVANRSDNSNEWIELKGPAGKSLKKVKISAVTAIETETTIYQFPDNDDVKFPSNGILLITDQNPANNDLAADLDKGVPKEGIRYRIRTLAPLPNDGNFLLVLRDTGGEIEDVAGYATGLSRNDPYTTLWPLAGNVGRIGAKNKLEADKVYHRARAIQGYSHNKDKPNETAFAKAGFTGVGYDRNAAVSDINGGTPGYPNNTVISAGADATKNIIISEIMYDSGKNDRLPQWIELYNMSAVKAVDLHNWRLYIVNHDDNSHFDDPDSSSRIRNEIWLRGVKIPPQQTALIVSRTGRQTTLLPRHRIVNAGQSLTEPLLNPKGFYLRLEANSHEGDLNKRQAGDEAGNLVAFDATKRRSDHQAFEDPVWELPNGADDNGDRFSISRRTDDNILRLDGTKKWHWVRADEDTRQFRMGSSTYYGHSTDLGSPGQTVGSVLPVSLSKFRPERLKATGEVVIRWITESELNNAGFNILRSDTRDGEYTKLNTQLIEGKGTTSERTTYEWKDTSAKPNVVYYYQIQDVSLDGQVQTLRQSRLKGNVNAAGKATTTWAELKALQ